MTSEEIKFLTATNLRKLSKPEVIYDDQRLAVATLVPYKEFMRLKMDLLNATTEVEGLMSEVLPQPEKLRRSIQ